MFTQPYNESKIIALITEYYHLLISLHYVTLDCIDFPPPQGRKISLPLCESLKLTPEVISLMNHIPCPIDEHVMLDYEFFLPNSYGNSFCSDRLIRMNRDPELQEREAWLRNTDIAITIMGDQGRWLVLDTAKNTLRIVEFDKPISPEENKDPHARYDFHPSSPLDYYTRWPIHCPEELLQSCIDKIRSLEWLPMKETGRAVLWTGGEGYERVKNMLVEDYGWGSDEFAEEKWGRDCERIWDETSRQESASNQMLSTITEETPNTGHWSRYMCWQQ